jgi:hypothetical protein
VVDVGTVTVVVDGVGGLVVGGTVACVVGGAATGATVGGGCVSGGARVGAGVAAISLVDVDAGRAGADTTGCGDSGVDCSPLIPTAAPMSAPTTTTPSASAAASHRILFDGA